MRLRAPVVCCFLPRPPPFQVIKIDAQEKLVAIKLTTLPPGVQPTPKVVAEKAEETAPPAKEA